MLYTWVLLQLEHWANTCEATKQIASASEVEISFFIKGSPVKRDDFKSGSSLLFHRIQRVLGRALLTKDHWQQKLESFRLRGQVTSDFHNKEINYFLNDLGHGTAHRLDRPQKNEGYQLGETGRFENPALGS